MKDKPVLEKKNLDKGLKRSVGKPACCVSKGGGSSNTASLPDQLARDKGFEKRAHSMLLRLTQGRLIKITLI